MPDKNSTLLKYTNISFGTAKARTAGVLPELTSNTFCPLESFTLNTSILDINCSYTYLSFTFVSNHKSILSPGYIEFAYVVVLSTLSQYIL